jgi:pimeloyl-ACP methyl ester carboxylesterase
MLFHERVSEAAWRTKPSWYAISRNDRTTSPDLERFLAKRMGATTVEIDSGHLSLITHPDEVTQLILEAARGARPIAAHEPGTLLAVGTEPGRPSTR